MPKSTIESFSFATSARIRFGWGCSSELPDEVEALGKQVLLISGRDPARYQPILDALKKRGAELHNLPVSTEPTVKQVLDGVELVRTTACEVVLAIGGGSVMDTGKGIAGLAANPGDPYDYLEVVGKGNGLKNAAMPCICVPTTSGSGAEVTRNAVLASPKHGVKVSLRSPYLLPELTLVDASLTVSCPPLQTATSGMDALTQLIEAFVSHHANPLTDGFCREGLCRAAASLKRACEVPNDRAARENMSLAALLSGMALANAKLGAVHGFAGPLGGGYDAPHGGICARLLPEVFRANYQRVREDSANKHMQERFDEVGQVLTGNLNASGEDAIEFLQNLCRQLSIPGLASYGLTESDFAEIIPKARKASSMKGNPVELSEAELEGILKKALQ